MIIETKMSFWITPDRVARTNWFVRAYLNTHMNTDYKTLTNKVCQCHPQTGLHNMKISLLINTLYQMIIDTQLRFWDDL